MPAVDMDAGFGLWIFPIMKAILEFTLPEEKPEHDAACRAGELISALHAIRDHIRCRLKYGDPDAAAKAELESIRELIPFELLG